jgi:hypothetical protein
MPDRLEPGALKLGEDQMKSALPLAAALFAGSAALAAVQALPVAGTGAGSDNVVLAAAKKSKTAKAGSCKGTHMYYSSKDKKCMDARNKKSA